MARAKPLYSIEDQYAKLDELIPTFSSFNTIKLSLLVACSESGDLPKAKNRFLNLIQDTEIRTVFTSILEVPEVRETDGVKSIQKIHEQFSSRYGLFEKAIRDLVTLGVPGYTIDLMTEYFYANEDPVYKLSIMAAIVMIAYVKDDEINNRKE